MLWQPALTRLCVGLVAGDLRRGNGGDDEEEEEEDSRPVALTLPAPYSHLHPQTDAAMRGLYATALARLSLSLAPAAAAFDAIFDGICVPVFTAFTAGLGSGVPPELAPLPAPLLTQASRGC